MTTLSYEDLVAAATVGLGSSQIQVTGLPGPAGEHAAVLDPGDPAAALLDAAALITTARRAGVLPGALPGSSSATLSGVSGASGTGTAAGTGPGETEPAPADVAPELTVRAAGLLARARAADPALLADLLTLAATRGYRAPAPLLPALLDAAVKDRSLRPPVAAVLGARGRWLARHRADWQRVADTATPEAAGFSTVGFSTVGSSTVGSSTGEPAEPRCGAGACGGGAGSQLWETGSRSERRGYLAALRQRDPEAARELLAAGWATETGDDRSSLLAVLGAGLSGADEPFLEQALDDRKESVRAVARRLLARLPGSGFSRRSAQRAAPLLRLERRAFGRQWLVASPPQQADESAIRDGISGPPPGPAIGQRAWLLTQMIASAPLAGWVTGLGMDAARIVSLPVAGHLGTDVRAGWRMAAISQASREWAEALLVADQPGATRGRPPAAWPSDAELAALLPPDALAARAAALLTAGAPAWEAVRAVSSHAGPWPPLLADAVMTALEQAVTTTARPGAVAMTADSAEDLAALAGHNLPLQPASPAAAGPPRGGDSASSAGSDSSPGAVPADYASALARLAEHGAASPQLSAALHRAAETVTLRHAFLKEIP